jgi:calcium/calmodulin-dependent protein kinase I
MGTETVT